MATNECMLDVTTNMFAYFYSSCGGIYGTTALIWGTSVVPKGFKMLFIDIFSVLIEFSSCKLNENITSPLKMSGQCRLKNICYRGNQALPGRQKGGEMGQKC